MKYIAKQSIIRLCKCRPRSKDKHAYLLYTYHKANVPDVQGIRRNDGRAAMEKESKTCLCVANEKNVGREKKKVSATIPNMQHLIKYDGEQ